MGLRQTLFAAGVAAVISWPASAAFYGYTLTIADDNGFNAPTFTLLNLSGSESPIDRFIFSIGDDTRNFDRIIDPLDDAPLTNATLIRGDEPDNGLRVDVFEIDFTPDLSADSTFSWRVDVDNDDLGGNPVGTVEDARNVFFNNNGDAANSLATAIFADGTELALTLDDQGDTPLNRYDFTATVPLPAALPLFVGGLAGIGYVLRRRRAA